MNSVIMRLSLSSLANSCAVTSSVTDKRSFTLNYTGDAPDALMTEGVLTFTGIGSPPPANLDLKMEVKSWVLATRTVTLFLPMPFDISPSDTLSISAGCDKSLAVCRATFDNVLNFRGEPYVPGNDLLFRTPDAR